MAVSAELSMKQAAALSQQQLIKEKELQVKRGPGHSRHIACIDKNVILSILCSCFQMIPSVSHYSSHSPLTTIEES